MIGDANTIRLVFGSRKICRSSFLSNALTRSNDCLIVVPRTFLAEMQREQRTQCLLVQILAQFGLLALPTFAVQLPPKRGAAYSSTPTARPSRYDALCAPSRCGSN